MFAKGKVRRHGSSVDVAQNEEGHGRPGGVPLQFYSEFSDTGGPPVPLFVPLSGGVSCRTCGISWRKSLELRQVVAAVMVVAVRVLLVRVAAGVQVPVWVPQVEFSWSRVCGRPLAWVAVAELW